ncbi:hypothetical protein [Chitinimonas koreensis]|uniref:hypothetical protein n=1 Tax=Chitinimonas koreensis TaxID=356302 RepID=UPI0004170409|nr:hypothetical protein [Chitinimonas koreensis]
MFRTPPVPADFSTVVVAPQPWRGGPDRWLLHRRLGLPIALLVFGLAADLALRLGAAAVPAVVATADALGATALLPVPASLRPAAAVLAGGSRLLAIWLPALIAFELILAMLRDCGYLARVACLIDRALWTLRLPGRAFAPMLAGAESTVPRRCGNAAERATACALLPQAVAGWPVCLLPAAVFWPDWGGPAALAGYLAGLAAALVAALSAQACWPGRPGWPPLPRPTLPAWRRPSPARVLRTAARRLAGFLAGSLVVLVAGSLLGVAVAWLMGGSMATGWAPSVSGRAGLPQVLFGLPGLLALPALCAAVGKCRAVVAAAAWLGAAALSWMAGHSAWPAWGAGLLVV